jgi:hypothetical protein
MELSPIFFQFIVFGLKLFYFELGCAHFPTNTLLIALFGVNLPFRFIVPPIIGLIRIFRIFIINRFVVVDRLFVLVQSLESLFVGTLSIFLESFYSSFGLQFLLWVSHTFDIAPSFLDFILSDLKVIHGLLILGFQLLNL